MIPAMKKGHTFFQYGRKKRPFLAVPVFLLALSVPLIAGAILFLPKAQQVRERGVREIPTPTMPIPSPAPYPVNTTGVYPSDEITAAGVVIVDVDSHVYLFERNASMRLSPASTTKLLTALVALDVYKLDDVIQVASASTGGQVMGLVNGERITVENLLYGALIHSGNDAAWTLAQGYPDGPEAFVRRMNEKAKALHMNDSNFTNPMGFDGAEHKVTPRDLAILSIAAIKHPVIAKMVAIPQITVSDVNHTLFHKLANVNQLLGKIPGVGGIKTGWTEEAGENLITYVERNNRKVILVVLHSKDRFGDTTKLIDWVFSSYRWEDQAPETKN